MQNPWLMLAPEPPYVLDTDHDIITSYNKKAEAEHRIDLALIPEPFIGSPQTATVVVLNLNPGLDEKDIDAHQHLSFKAALFRNLRHELQEYPFYPLNPEFSRTPCAVWWGAHTRRLLERVDAQAVAQKLLVIEWFPYHSRKGNKLPGKPLCESQQYSFALLKEMLERCFVIGMRGKTRWKEIDKRIEEVPFAQNPRSCHISPANFGEDIFDRVVHALSNERLSS
jgi:hypothetical protein